MYSKFNFGVIGKNKPRYSSALEISRILRSRLEISFSKQSGGLSPENLYWVILYCKFRYCLLSLINALPRSSDIVCGLLCWAGLLLFFFLRLTISAPMIPTANSNRAVLFEIETDRSLFGPGIWYWWLWRRITDLLCTSINLRTPIPHIIMLINAINARFLIFILTLSGSIGFKGGFVMPVSIMWMYFWNWHSLVIGAYSGCQKTFRY